MEVDDETIKNIYTNIIKANAKTYSLNIDFILTHLMDYNNYDYNDKYPIYNALELELNSIMMGVDNNAYIVKINSKNRKYWHPIPRL
jgi:hypothetical protein